MLIPEKILKQWRKEALEFKRDIKDMPDAGPTNELCYHILALTQELLDQHLMDGTD